MIGICFFFEDYNMNLYSGRWDGDIRLWLDTSTMYNFDKIIEIDISTDERGKFYDKNKTNHRFDRFKILEEAEEKYKDHHFVYMEDPRTLKLNNIWENSISLDNFIHPKENVIYVLGPDSGNYNVLYNKQNKANCSFVHILAPNPQAIWSIIVLGLIGDDRRRKGL